MQVKRKNPKRIIAMLLCGGAMIAATPQSPADTLGFCSFESAGSPTLLPGELPFVTTLVGPATFPASPAIWFKYPDASTPTTGETGAIFYSDTFNDYFTVTSPGSLDLVQSTNPDIAGRDGAWELTAEDITKDSIGSGTSSITFDPVNLNGYSDVKVKMLLGAADTTTFETADFIRIEAKEPGGATTRIGYFTADGTARMAQDTDDNNAGDGLELGLTYQEFTFDVPAGLFSMQLEIDVDVDADEEVFIDNIRIEGTGGGTIHDPIMVVNTADIDAGRVNPSATRDTVISIANSPFATQNLIVNNTTSITGTDAGRFSILTPLPLNIAPGTSQDLTLRLTGATTGGVVYDDAMLNINTNDNVTPSATINLKGRTPSTVVATVEVSGVQNSPTTFGTIDQAVDYLDANAVGQPWVINVTTDGPTVEPTAIDLKTNAFGGVRINGDANNNGIPYTIITDAAAPGSQANYATGTTWAAMVLEADAAPYNLNNLKFVPSYVGPGASLDTTFSSGGVRVLTIDDYDNGPLVTKNIVLENFTIAGSLPGNVAADDPNSNVFATTTHYGRGISTFSSSTTDPSPVMSTLVMKNVKIFNIDLECFSHSGDYMDLDVLEGCVFAYTGETPFLVSGNTAGSLTMAGTSTNRIFITGSGLVDTDEEGLSVVPDSNFGWDYMGFVDVVSNGAEMDFGPTQGPEVMEYCRFAFSDLTNDDADGTDTGARYGYGTDLSISPTTTRIIRNCTFHDGMNPAGTQYGLNFYGLMNGFTFNVTDCIFSGSGDIALNLRAGGESTVNLSNVALVTAGTHALTGLFDGTYDGSTGNFTLNQSGIVNDDPVYANETYVYGNSEDFLLPTAAAYLNAASGGGLLYGGAAPNGTSVIDWSIY